MIHNHAKLCFIIVKNVCEEFFLIISRYLSREIFYNLAALTGLLVLIYISHRFMHYLIQAASGALPAEFIFKLVGLKLLSDLMLILPLGFFLAILLALGRLYKDNEITALAACGIAVPFKTIVGLGVVFSLFIGTLSLILSPWAVTQTNLLKKQASTTAEVSSFMAGRFKEFNQGNGIFYIEAIEESNMKNVFVQANLPDKRVILVAQHAYQTTQANEMFMVLLNGYRYEARPNSLAYVITQFGEHAIRIPKPLIGNENNDISALSIGELWQKTEPIYQAELQWRFSLPLSVILLAALAVPLSRTTPRQGQYAKIFAGILIYLIYSNLSNVAQKWVAQGTVPTFIGVWWVHIILAIIIAILLYLPNFKK